MTALAARLWLALAAGQWAALCATDGAAGTAEFRPVIATRADVEWVELRSVGDARLAFIATAAHEVLIADLHRGPDENPLLSVRAGPGVRFALDEPGAEPDAREPRRFYAFDLYSVFAIDVEAAGAPRLAWRRGDWPAGVATDRPGAPAGVPFQGDPESLATIVGAAAVRDGVVVARSDGRVSLSADADGAPRWVEEREPPGVSAFSVSGPDQLVMLASAGGRVEATFVPAVADDRRAVRVPLGERWPTLWRAIPDGLVAAWPDRVVLLRMDGRRTEIPARPLLRQFSAKLLDVCPPSDPETSAHFPPGREPLLIAADETGAVGAFGAGDGRLSWFAVAPALPPPMLHFAPASLRVQGAYALAVDGTAIALYACAGRTQPVFSEAGWGEILAATVAGDRLLYAARSWTDEAPQRDVLLVRVVNPLSGAARALRCGAVPCSAAGTGRVGVDLRWSGSTLVLISRRELRALTVDAVAD